MSVAMQPAQLPGSAGDVPDVVHFPVNGTETWLKGTVLKLVSEEWQEVTVNTDNGSLYAVSLEGATSGDPDGVADTVAAARIDTRTYFLCHADDGAGAIITDLSGIAVGQQGDLNVINDVYTFDSATTGSPALEVVNVLDDHDLVLVKFISTVIG